VRVCSFHSNGDEADTTNAIRCVQALAEVGQRRCPGALGVIASSASWRAQATARKRWTSRARTARLWPKPCTPKTGRNTPAKTEAPTIATIEDNPLTLVEAHTAVVARNGSKLANALTSHWVLQSAGQATKKELAQMTFCVVTREYAGLNGSYGIGSAVRGFVEILINTGVHVDVLVTDATLSYATVMQTYSTEYGNLNFIYISDIAADDDDIFLPVDDISNSYVIYKYLKKSKYTVIHFFGSNGGGFYAAMSRRQGGLDAKIVTHVFDSSDWDRKFNLTPPKLGDFERETIERSQIENSDWVISPSDYLLQWYRNDGVTLPQTCSINWVLSQWITKTDQGGIITPLMTRSLAAERLKELIFFGRHERRKGFNLFVEAVRRLPPDIQPDLTFLGEFDRVGLEFSGSYVMRMLSHYGGRIRFINNLDQDQALARMQNSANAICVMPSLIENSPSAIGECFTIGVPFLVADVGAVADLIDPASHAFCLIKPDAACFAETIVRVSQEGIPSLRSTLGPETIVSKWREWHDTLLQEPSPSFAVTATPLVSVCLTHYERPTLLRRALNGLMAQTYDCVEIIIVDDGSRQLGALTCLDEIEAAQHRYPVRVVRSENRYLGAARNLAASFARGEYLLFHDDDNIAEPNEIEVLVRAAQRSGCDILTCQCWMFRGGEETIALRKRKIENYWIGIGGIFAFFYNRFGDANALVRRATFQTLGGFTELRGVGQEDWEFFLRAYLRGFKMGVVPEPLYNYRVSARGMRLTGNLQPHEERIYSMIDEERPRMSSDLLRYAKWPQQRKEMLAQLADVFSGLAGGELHQEMLSLDPNSQAAKQKLSDLAFELGRIADAIEIGASDHHQRLKLIGLMAQLEKAENKNVRAGCTIVPDATAGMPILMLKGWAFTHGGKPHLPRSLVIDGGRYEAIALCALDRPDVAKQFDLQVKAKIGFAIAVIARPQRAFYWRKKRFTSSERRRIELIDKTDIGFAGHIDEVVMFQMVSLTPPSHECWRGCLTIETGHPTNVFVKTNVSDVAFCSDKISRIARFSLRSFGVSEVTVIIPADGETAVTFE
jgi:glycosyltransferase involved in cell wall biosynthesis